MPVDVPRKTQSDHSVLRQKRLQRGEDAVLAHAPMHPRGASVEDLLSAHNTPVDVGLLLPARSQARHCSEVGGSPQHHAFRAEDPRVHGDLENRRKI